jgi:hypothetical protein
MVIYALRLPNLINFPLFIDETVHLYAAEVVLRDSSPLFQVWLGRQFTILWYALFGAPLAAPAFVARFVTLLLVLLGAAALLNIARRFGGITAMVLTGVLYAFSAYHLFFERLALADNVAGAAILLSVWVASRLKKRVHARDALAVGVLLFLAFGAKVSALPYFGIPVAAALTLIPRGRPVALTVRWLGIALGSMALLTAAYVLGVRARGMDVIENSLSLAASARATVDLGVLLSPARIFGNVIITVEVIASYSIPIGLVMLIGLSLLLLRKQFYLPLVAIAPLLPMWISVVQETRFLVSAVALLLTTSAIGTAYLLEQLPLIYRHVAVVGIAGVAFLSWWSFALPMYTNVAALPLPDRDQRQYLQSDASGFNLREAASFISQRGDVVEIIGALPNCQSLRYMTLHTLPVSCPGVSPNPATGTALLELLEKRRETGVYLILERNPYIPQTVPGVLLTEINAPILNRPTLAIYSLAPDAGSS